MTHICLIADCGPTIGLGHLRRCMVLAKHLSARGGTCEIRIPSPEPTVLGLINDAGFTGSALASETDATLSTDVIIYDGRFASAAQLANWKQDCSCFVVLDDLADRPVTCDIIINPNIYGGDLDYGAYTAETVLAGPAHNLVAPAFFECRAKRQPQTPPRILISLGGTDDGHIGAPIAAEILSGADAAVDLVISPIMAAAPSVAELSANWGERMTVHHGADMARLMLTASSLVCGGGGTILEGLAAGPRPVAVRLAANQDLNITKFKEWGICAFLPDDTKAIVRAAIDAIGNIDAPNDCDKVNPTGVDDIASEILNRFPSPVFSVRN